MKRIFKDERGSSLVMTMISIAFIAILAAAVLAMTITNIQLKTAQKRSQKNFYDADDIVDTIKAGISDVSATAAEKAYLQAFSQYGAVRSGNATESLADTYKNQYLKSMINALSDGGCSITDTTPLFYKDEVIRGYLIASKSDLTLADGYQSHTNGRGELVYEDDTLLLKDIVVVKTEGGYRTKINTNIRITVPEMSAETHSEYLDYAMIADNQIIADQGGNTTYVEGNVYAGTVDRFDAGATNPESGFVIKAGSSLDIKAKDIVSRGDIFLTGGSTLRIGSLKASTAANVWVENIETKGGNNGTPSNNVLNISGVTNVADDMELWGQGDAATLTGNYYGYNYNKTYDAVGASTMTNSAEFSSAILINGFSCKLNVTGLDYLSLAGRTFISKKLNPGETLTGGLVNPDIAMGESLTVKGSQLAYYVPNDFIHEDKDSEVVTFDVDGYNSFIGFDIKNYIDTANPLNVYIRNDSKVENVSYYYLNFASDALMTQFYNKYRQTTPNYKYIKDSNKKFLQDPGIQINEGSGVIIRNGTVLYSKEKVDANGVSTFEESIKLKNESISVDSGLAAYAREKSIQYLSKQMALTDDYDGALKLTKSNIYRLSGYVADKNQEYSKSGKKSNNADGTNDGTNLFNRIVDVSKMPKTAADDVNEMVGDGRVILASGNYTWNSTSASGATGAIIIALGTVKVQADFNGLIIAGKDVIVSPNIKLSADAKLLEKMFDEDKNSASPLFYDMFTKYLRKTVDSSLGKSGADKDSNVECEKWKKNKE